MAGVSLSWVYITLQENSWVAMLGVEPASIKRAATI